MEQKNETENTAGINRLATVLIAGTFVLLFVLMLNTLRGRSPQEPGDETRHAQAVADVKMLGKAVEQYATEKGNFPRKLDELAPKYIQKVPLDPYGKRYRLVDGGHQVWVAYYGKDGKNKGYTAMDVDVMHSVQMPKRRAAPSR